MPVYTTITIPSARIRCQQALKLETRVQRQHALAHAHTHAHAHTPQSMNACHLDRAIDEKSVISCSVDQDSAFHPLGLLLSILTFILFFDLPCFFLPFFASMFATFALTAAALSDDVTGAAAVAARSACFSAFITSVVSLSASRPTRVDLYHDMTSSMSDVSTSV